MLRVDLDLSRHLDAGRQVRMAGASSSTGSLKVGAPGASVTTPCPPKLSTRSVPGTVDEAVERMATFTASSASGAVPN